MESLKVFEKAFLRGGCLILEGLLVVEMYTFLDGRKDPILETVDLQYSVWNLMVECVDSESEETTLQYLRTHLGVHVDGELAGEGI